MNRIKQIIYTIMGVLFVGILCFGAMIFPKYYNLFYDNKTLNQVTYMDSALSTYEVSYDSFYEKLHAIALCNYQDKTLHSVKVKEVETSIDNKKLTEIVKGEIKTLHKEGIIGRKIALNTKELSLREMYTLYIADDEETLKGINYWKIMYDSEEYSITIFLDTEYHKIYGIQIKEKKNNHKYFTAPPDKSTTSGSMVDSDGKWTMIPEQFFSFENNYTWMSKVMEYYRKDKGSWFYEDETVGATSAFQRSAVMEFNDGSMLHVRLSLDLDKYKLECWKAGIDLEYMLQF